MTLRYIAQLSLCMALAGQETWMVPVQSHPCLIAFSASSWKGKHFWIKRYSRLVDFRAFVIPANVGPSPSTQGTLPPVYSPDESYGCVYVFFLNTFHSIRVPFRQLLKPPSVAPRFIVGDS